MQQHPFPVLARLLHHAHHLDAQHRKHARHDVQNQTAEESQQQVGEKGAPLTSPVDCRLSRRLGRDCGGTVAPHLRKDFARRRVRFGTRRQRNRQLRVGAEGHAALRIAHQRIHMHRDFAGLSRLTRRDDFGGQVDRAVAMADPRSSSPRGASTSAWSVCQPHPGAVPVHKCGVRAHAPVSRPPGRARQEPPSSPRRRARPRRGAGPHRLAVVQRRRPSRRSGGREFAS